MSLLKIGIHTQSYGCDDDTIVFNSIVCLGIDEPIEIKDNQVVVLLNYCSFYLNILLFYSGW